MSEIRVDTISEKTSANGVAIDSVTLKDGGATLTDNITFSASGKGVHLGVTTATSSNLLDDYEEGTFTPTYAGSSGGSVTMVASVGTYVKVGKIVHIMVRAMTSAESLSGDITITGLPFTSVNTTNHQTALSIQGLRFASDMPNLAAYILNNVTAITLEKAATTSTGGSLVQGSDLSNSTNYNIVKIAGSYEI
jgi:hypothetical protein